MHILSISFFNLLPCFGTILHTHYDAFWRSDRLPTHRLEFAVIWHVGDYHLFLIHASESCSFASYCGLCYTTLAELGWPFVLHHIHLHGNKVGNLLVKFGKNFMSSVAM